MKITRTATHKVFSTLEVKSVNDDMRVIDGIASTPGVDRMGDIVEPKGARFKLPIPLLWQHESDEQVGEVTAAKVGKDGISISAQFFAPNTDSPEWNAELRKAWAKVKAGAVRGLSIGFMPVEGKAIDGSWGTRFTEWDWLELSCVTIPANAEASIETVKSIVERGAPLSGQKRGESVRLGPQSPGVPGANLSTQGTTMTNKEMIAAAEAKRASNAAAMQKLLDDAANDSRTLDASEVEQYDTFKSETKDLDADIERRKDMEAMAVKTATPAVDPQATGQEPRRQAARVEMKSHNLPKGTGFTRLAISIAFAKGNPDVAAQIAQRWKDTTPEVANILKYGAQNGGTDFATQTMQMGGLEAIQKTAIAAGTTTDATWASPLVQYNNLASEFVELLYPKTIIGRIQGLRRVPFNIRFPSQTAGATVGWVGQGAGKPVSKLAFATTTLGFAKAAGIVVITQELARFSSPAAEQLVQTDLVNTMSQFLDQQFISPGVAAVANVSPAAITNGITAVQSGGSTRVLIDADVASVMSTFLTNNIALDSLVWIMTPYSALKLSMLRETNGEFSYPDININGGTWQGIPVLTSNNVPSSVSAGSIIVLVSAGEVFLADDGGVQLDASQEASLQMDSAPTNTGATPTATSLVSLWQDNLIGIRAERIINWQRRRDTAIGYVDNVHL